MQVFGIDLSRPFNRMFQSNQQDQEPNPLSLLWNAEKVPSMERANILVQFEKTIDRLADQDLPMALRSAAVAVNNATPDIHETGMKSLLSLVEKDPVAGFTYLTEAVKRHAETGRDKSDMIDRTQKVWTASAEATLDAGDQQLAFRGARSLLDNVYLGETAADFLVVHDQTAVAPVTLQERALRTMRPASQTF